MSWPPVHIGVSITVQYCDHSHNLVLNQGTGLPLSPGGGQRNNTLLAIDKTSSYFLLLKAHMKSSKLEVLHWSPPYFFSLFQKLRVA